MEKIKETMEKGAYWIGVIDDKNFDILLKKNAFGLKNGSQKKIKTLNEGDFITFYILGKEIAGVFKVVSKPYEANKEIFNKSIYPIRFNLKKSGDINRKQFQNTLIENLSFIKNKKNWGGSFQGKAIVKIEKEDFIKIKKYLER